MVAKARPWGLARGPRYDSRWRMPVSCVAQGTCEACSWAVKVITGRVESAFDCQFADTPRRLCSPGAQIPAPYDVFTRFSTPPADRRASLFALADSMRPGRPRSTGVGR